MVLDESGPLHSLILPTYTAMLEVRGVLASRGLVQQFWEDQIRSDHARQPPDAP